MAAVWIAVVALAAALSAWLYVTREPRVPGWRWALGLRLAALLLLGLLLIDPLWPPGGARELPSRPLVLLDGGGSMWVADREGERAWDRAARRASEIAPSGGEVARADAAGLSRNASPAVGDTAPLPAPVPDHGDLVLRAGELGFRPILFLSDFRSPDAGMLFDGALRAGLDVRPVAVGALVRNAGLASFHLPPRIPQGDRPRGRLVLFHEGTAEGDSATVEIFEEGARVGSQRVAMTEGWGRITIEMELPAARVDEGSVRYRARVTLPEDAFSDDDARTAYVEVESREGGVVLLSYHPDWEPRYLLPVLGQVSGLPVRGWFRVGDRYLAFRRAGGSDATGDLPPGADPGGPVSGPGGLSEEELRGWVRDAHLLVIQGEGDAPEWVSDAVGAAARVLRLPGSREGTARAGLVTSTPLAGEWDLDEELPPSPLGPFLAGLDPLGLPPLTGVLAPVEEAGMGGWRPALTASFQGRGNPEPVVLLREGEGGRREVLFSASGFWRWGAREGTPREAYRRVVSAAAGWLMAGADATPPGSRVQASGAVHDRFRQVGWSAPGREGERLTVRLEPLAAGDGDEPDSAPPGVPSTTESPASAGGGFGGAEDIQVVVGRPGVAEPGAGVLPEGFLTGPHPPGAYRYVVESAEGTTIGEGRFDVEAYRGDLAHPPTHPAALTPDGAAPAAEEGRPPASPLRHRPLAYLLLMGLLCGEWWVRRRSGLR